MTDIGGTESPGAVLPAPNHTRPCRAYLESEGGIMYGSGSITRSDLEYISSGLKMVVS